MLSNTRYLRIGLVLAFTLTLMAGLFQFTGHRHNHGKHHHHDQVHETLPMVATDETLYNGSVELPLFPGCNEGQDYETRRRCARVNMSRYLNEYLNKDLLDRKGRVYIRFVVDLAGQLQNARLVEETDPVLAAEVMRLVGRMQGQDLRWEPGKIRGTPRAMNATLQVSFGQRCKGCEEIMVAMVP